MEVLITNDDGIFAEGLDALVKAIRKIGRVTVVAPEEERSAAGHSLTFFKPLRVRAVKDDHKGFRMFATTGTPSDCVLLALYDIMPRKPDLVISGINRGANMGDDITYSGTVSAAMEGVIHGIPSFSISLAAYQKCNYSVAAKFSAQLARMMSKMKLPPYTLLNVNVPSLPEQKIKGIALTRQGRTTYRDRLEKRVDPRGMAYYWIAGESPEGDSETGTDWERVADGYISVTPLQLDLTHHALLKELHTWDWIPFWKSKSPLKNSKRKLRSSGG